MNSPLSSRLDSGLFYGLKIGVQQNGALKFSTHNAVQVFFPLVGFKVASRQEANS